MSLSSSASPIYVSLSLSLWLSASISKAIAGLSLSLSLCPFLSLFPPFPTLPSCRNPCHRRHMHYKRPYAPICAIHAHMRPYAPYAPRERETARQREGPTQREISEFFCCFPGLSGSRLCPYRFQGGKKFLLDKSPPPIFGALFQSLFCVRKKGGKMFPKGSQNRAKIEPRTPKRGSGVCSRGLSERMSKKL